MPDTPVLAATTGGPWTPPLDYVQRVRAYYRRTSATYQQPVGSTWRMFADNFRQAIHETLIEGTDAEVAVILGDPASHNLNYGMDPIAKNTVEGLQASAPRRDGLLRRILRSMRDLAETIGARRAWNPEPNQGPAPDADPDDLVAEIDRALGAPIPYPNPFPSEYGIKTQRGIIGRRVPLAIHHAWLLRNLADLVGNARIVEIGGGLGRTAVYARTFGLTDYTIIDIPLSTISQAAFLGAALGPDAVWFDGEAPRPGAVRLVPPDWIGRTTESFGITLNANSITEMTEVQACEYVAFAARNSLVMISINHEANPFRAFDLPAMIGVRCHYQRALSVLCPGYVEECFFFRAIKLDIVR